MNEIIEKLLLDLEADNLRLRVQNGRLRKAVNWLRGANHDGSEAHLGTVDACDVWECQRARDVLEETKE